MADEVEEIIPVVMTKPKRGQEIASTPIVEELYHEGFIEGKRYLVPDSNLEAMKDTINLRMRPRKSTRYKHQTSYELADYEHFKLKLNKILQKIDEVPSSSSSESTVSTSTEYIQSALTNNVGELIDKEDENIHSTIGQPERAGSRSELLPTENDDEINSGKSKYETKSGEEDSKIQDKNKYESEGCHFENKEPDSDDHKKDNKSDTENEVFSSGVRKVECEEKGNSDIVEFEHPKMNDMEEENSEMGGFDSGSQKIKVEKDQRSEHKMKIPFSEVLSKPEEGEEKKISENIQTDRENKDLEFNKVDNSETEESKSETNNGADQAPKTDNLEPDNIEKLAIKPLSGTAVNSKAIEEPMNLVNETIVHGMEPEAPSQLLKEQRLRFIISGHLQKGKHPIYIIQEYEGGESIFGEQKADFISRKNEGGTDIIISGKFYKRNILEESNEKPAYLNTKPNKILINPETSKIYYNFFEEKFSMSSVELIINGKFIKNNNNMTPFFAFKVKQKLAESKKQNGQGKFEQSKHIFYNTGLENKNPFINADHSTSNEELKHQKYVNHYNTTYIRRIMDNCYYFTRPKLLMTKEIISFFQNKSMSKIYFFNKHPREDSFTNIMLKSKF